MEEKEKERKKESKLVNGLNVSRVKGAINTQLSTLRVNFKGTTMKTSREL